jgi:zinc protease
MSMSAFWFEGKLEIGIGRRRKAALQVRLLLSLSLVFLGAVRPALARDFPPEVGPPKPIVIPAPAVRVLSNGLKVLVIERHTLPLLTLRFVVEAGAEADPAALPGAASLLSAVITQGTAHRTAQQIAETVDSAGGLIDSGADWDESYVTLSVLTDHVRLAYDLLSDSVMHPSFAPAEVERQRKQTLSALDVLRGDPSYIADTAFQKLIFAGTPYSHPLDGTLETVRRISPEELRAFHDRYYRPTNAILAVVGDTSAEAAFTLAEEYFGTWPVKKVTPAGAAIASPKTSRHVVVIDKADAVQTEIRVGDLGVSRNSPDYYALSIANQVLGGPASNRLFKALRTRQGLTYAASSALVCHRTLGAWVVKTSTRTSETSKSTHITLEAMKSLRDHRINPRELYNAQSYLVGHLALEFETSDDIADQFLELMLNNLPLDYWNQFPDKINAVTREDVQEAARRYLDPDHDVIVLVGNRAGFQKDLDKLGPLEILPLDDVDFGSPTLLQRQLGAGK